MELPKTKFLTLFGILVILLAFTGQVRSTGIATGSYFLDTPLPLATFYVGQYSNNTYFVVNGSNWQNFLRTENASYLFEMCIGNMTSGGKISVGLGCYDFDSTVTIDDEGVYIEGEATAYAIVGTVFNFTGTNGPLFKYTHADTHQFFGGISNCELRGNDGIGTIAIQVEKFYSDLWFENLFIRSFADAGIQIEGGSGEYPTSVSKTWNIWIKNCLIEENNAGTGYAVYLTNADSKNHSISRITIDDSCHFYNNNHSLYTDNEWIFNLEFTDNTVEQEQQESIYLLGGRRVIISENRIFDIGTDAINTYSAIYIGNTTGGSPPVAINIVDNVIGNHWIENQSKYMVELQGTCDHIRVTDNIFESWKTVSPLDPILRNTTGTDIVTEPNQGYNFPSQGKHPYSYYIFKVDSTHYMRNGSTGIIDLSSSNASYVINQCIENTTIIRGTIRVGRADYTFDSKIVMKSNVTLLFEHGTVINQTKVSWTGTEGTFDFRGVNENNLIENAHVTSDGQATLIGADKTSEKAFYGVYATNCLFENFIIQNIGGSAGLITVTTESIFRNLDISLYALTDNTQCIHLTGGSEWNTFENIHFDGVGANTFGGGFYCTANDNGNVTGNKFLNIRCENRPTTHAFYGESANNRFQGNYIQVFARNMSNGVQLNSGQDNIVDITAVNCTVGFSMGSGANAGVGAVGNIINCAFIGGYSGAHIFVQDTDPQTSIAHNIIHLTVQDASYGIYFDQGQTGNPNNHHIIYNEIHITARNDVTYGIGFLANLNATTEAKWNDFYCQINVSSYAVRWYGDYGRHNHFYGNLNGVTGTFSNVANYTTLNSVGNMTGNINTANWRIGDIITNASATYLYLFNATLIPIG